MAEASDGGGLERLNETCGRCGGSTSTVSPDDVCSNCSGQPLATSAHPASATRGPSITSNSATGGHGSDPASLASAERDDVSSNSQDRIPNGKSNNTSEEIKRGRGGNNAKETPGDRTNGKPKAIDEQPRTGGSGSQLPANRQQGAVEMSQPGTGGSQPQAGGNRQQGGGENQQEVNTAATPEVVVSFAETAVKEEEGKVVQRVVCEEITVPRIKAHSHYHFGGISFGTEEILIPVSKTVGGWFDVRRYNGQKGRIPEKLVTKLDPLTVVRNYINIPEMPTKVDEKEYNEEVELPVVMTTAHHQEKHFTFGNRELLIPLDKAENNLIKVMRWNGQEGCIPNDLVTYAEPLKAVMKVKRKEMVLPPVTAKASSGSATLSAVNKTTGTPKIGTADTQNSQASNTTKPSQKKKGTEPKNAGTSTQKKHPTGQKTNQHPLSSNQNTDKAITTQPKQGNVPALTAQFESDTTSWPETVVISSPLPDNSGFIENSHMGMTVHMNVLLPIDMWDFDQKKSEVFVCFGHKKLGQWDPVKKLDFIRAVDEHLLQFACDVCIDTKALKDQQNIPYKYYVWSEKEKNPSKRFEYIHGYYYSTDIINRCLCIPDGQIGAGGSFHQYDGIMHPEVPVKSAWKTLQTFVGYSSDSPKPVHDEVQQKCLSVYLDPFKQTLLECSVNEHSKIHFEIMHIYFQMVSSKVCFESNSCLYDAPSVKKTMKEWLLTTVQELKQLPCDSAVNNGNRIVSVLTVLLCFCHLIPQHFFMSDIRDDDIALLLSMLKIYPDEEKKRCFDYEHVQRCTSSMDQQVKKSLTETVVQFCNELRHRNHLNYLEWLYAVPLLHFLQGVSCPFGTIELDADKIEWNDRNLGLNELRKQVFDGDVRLIEDHYDALKPLLSADPKLLPLLLYICPKKQLPLLIHHIPLYISVAWLIKMLQLRPVSDVCLLASETLKCLKQSKSPVKKPQLEAVVMSSMKLLPNLTKKLGPTRINESCNGLGVVVSLALYAAHFLKQSSLQICNENMRKICNCVSAYISENIPTPFHIMMQDQTSYQMDEMTFWNQMLNLDCPESEIQLWHDLIAAALQKRLEIMQPMYKINLIIMLGLREDAHHMLKDKFIAAVEERLMSFDNKILLKSELKKINKNTTNKALVAVILMKILNRQYPTGVGTSTQTALLSWGIWPTCLEIHSSFPYQQETLKCTFPQSDEEELYKSCTHVVETVTNVYSSVISGAVTIKELRELETQKEHLCKLFVAGCSEEGTMNERRRDLDTAIKKHKSQYNELIGKVDQLKIILSNVSSYLTIERGQHILQQLSTNFEDVHINILCSEDDVEHSLVPLLAEIAPLNPIIDGYMYVADLFPSEMFKHIWLDKIKELRKIGTGTLSVEEIPTKLWDPVIEKCADLLTTLQQCTITLAVVDKYFSKYKCHKNAALDDMVMLFQGFHEFHDKFMKSEKDVQSIQNAVNLIEEYWSLRSYATAAKTCLEMKERLHLEGDFGEVKKLAEQNTLSLEEQSLRDVDNTLIRTGKFLQDFAAEDKLSSLQIYCDCLGIVSWLQDNIKDVNDLKTFVNVALNNAATGEDTLTNAKLSVLRTVGSGFGCLIYDLPKQADFKVLKQQCMLLWENMSTTPDLPQYLKTCNDEVEWFKKVMAQQGSVKETSFGQLDACIKHGTFRVGQRGADIFHNMSDIVKLTVDSKHGRVYNLDGLKDLESKLVLITGSKDERRKTVDEFLDIFHSICEIAEVLMVLQQVGNVKYIGWYITVPCSPELIPELRKLHSLMQRELEKWRRAVRCSREYHYELNYFTTPQLLTLRQALGHSAASSSHSINSQVLALLHSISSHISIQSVNDAVQRELESGTVQEYNHMQKSPDFVQPVTSEIQDVSHALELQAEAKCFKAIELSLTDAEISQDPVEVNKRMIIANVVSLLGKRYEKLVQQAFSEGQTDQIEIENWVRENEHLLDETTGENDSAGSDQEEKDEEEEEEEDDEEEDDEVKEADVSFGDESLRQSDAPPQFQSESSNKFEEDLCISIKEAVDVSHPGVQEVIGAGFSEEESILAFEACGTTEDAVAYLINMRTGGTSNQSPLATERTETFGTERLVKITCYHKVEQRYLTLNQLGNVLEILNSSHSGAVQQARTFHSKLLKVGTPNLLVVPPDQVLKTALSLYMEDKFSPLPTFEEILICTPTTTAEEVDLLWRRAVEDPRQYRTFCLVHAENLPYHTSDQALQCLHEAMQGRKGYRLVIICSSDKEDSSLIVSKLSHLRVPYLPPQDLSRYKEYLDTHFTTDSVPALNNLSSSVRVVSSSRAGMGKSLYIRNMAEQLSKIQHMSTVTVTVPIHGPKLSVEALIDKLKDFMDNKHCVIHLDIAPTVMWQLDTTLFSMMLQGGISDSKGRVWRRHPNQMYAIEVTRTNKEEKLKEKNCQIFAVLDILPIVQCVKPQQCLSFLRQDTVDSSLVLMNEDLFKSSQYQRVYQYLRRHQQNENLDVFTYRQNSVDGTTTDCLQLFLRYCGVKDPSWAEIGHFVNFLEVQLRLCEQSVFCKQQIIGDVLTGFKNFVVKFMMRMSQDFATSSLKGEIVEENDEIESIQRSTDDSDLEQYQIHERKQWEQNSHPYLFFNRDGMSVTFVGFMVSKAGDLIDANRTVIERSLMTPELQGALKDQGVNFEDNYQTWSKQKMVQKIGTVMGLSLVQDPDKSYVLTVDNLLKILAIQMRFRCGIPVVVMGETGCGKTRLIRYMCNLAAQSSNNKNIFILKVHGGTTDTDIAKIILCAKKHAVENRKHKLDTVVFFDEANTTDAIGLISEIMCDRTMHGKEISKELKFIAACNPYRRHTDDMVKKLETAGLGFFVQADETQQKLGTIPLRNLVYRVQDLPPSMRPLVYDFGQLNTSKEGQYITQIVSDHVNEQSDLSKFPSGTVEAVAQVLSWSQEHMKTTKDECSFVSLRDVERAMIVFEYFYEKMRLFSPLMDKMERNYETEPWLQVPVEEIKMYLTRSLVLALSVCYHARLQERRQFEEGVVKQFVHPLFLPGGIKQFQSEIRKCQEVLLDNMELGKNIARNTALRENVFMMAICIDLRIPLFLVGKPGSSKSLAKSIVSNSMNGKSSKTELLKSFKEVSMFSYQCSQLSTSESIIKVFDTAKSFQTEDTTTFVSVVVLDEVGLAEDSPNLPLKALHPLLEDGTAGSDKHKNDEEDDGDDDNYEIIKREERVAFIGISNWALDPAKMNRGVMVTRGDPDEKELELSARGICSTREEDPVRDHLEPYFRPLAEAYFAICAEQKRQFFGLRDFYSLIKMLYWMCESSGMPPSGLQLRHAILRNFGGMQEFSPYEEFKRKLPDTLSQAEISMIQDSYSPINPDCSPRGLIKASLQTRDTSWHGENRYLLFLTENYAALEVLKHYIHEPQPPSTHLKLLPVKRPQIVDEEIMSPDESSMKELEAWEMDPYVLFGSSFPKDTEYTQVCRNINQIKICMETGRMVVLLNLHNLYESLYDLLNQYYIIFGKERYVDLGLQTHKLQCRVHKEFKLIMIAEKETVYEKFPTPLINRLEKHFVLVSSVLSGNETEVMTKLKSWVKRFATISSRTFREQDAFIGYREDTTAAVVFQANRQLQRLSQNTDPSSAEWIRLQNIGIHPDHLQSQQHGSEIPKSAVEKLSQYLLLCTASPAALVRLLSTNMSSQFDHLCQMYKSQHHSSISDFLHYQLQLFDSNSKLGLLMQVTTHSHLLSYDEVKEVQKALGFKDGNVMPFLLQDFDTELHFSSKVGPFFKTRKGRTPCKLIIIQCDMGYIADDLIACARNRVYDMRAKAARESKFYKNFDPNEEHVEVEDVVLGTHVLFIVYLPVQTLHSSLVGFQGDPWISAHIDEIRPSSESILTLDIAQGVSISKLFYAPLEDDEMSEQISPPLLPEIPADYGPNVQHIKYEGGPNTPVLSPAPYSQVLTSGSGTTTQVLVPFSAGPTGQVVPAINSGPYQQMISSVSSLGELQEEEMLQAAPKPANIPQRQHKVIPRMYTQCRRLHVCIQAAASRLVHLTPNKKWATKRVEWLTDFIAREPTFPIDERSFYGILVKHIHCLLKQRGHMYGKKSNWVLNEAMNLRKLHIGGTFKNALSRKLDNVVIPLFAELIAVVDHNYNLRHLKHLSTEQTPVQELWLRMFSDAKVLQLNYADIVGREKVPVIDDNFECQLPFSWLIKDAVDGHLEQAKSTCDNDEDLYYQLCSVFPESPIGEVLSSFDCHHSSIEFIQRYVKDFVKMMHKCKHSDRKYVEKEYKLLSTTLMSLAESRSFLKQSGHISPSDEEDAHTDVGQKTLTSQIIAVHVVYHSIEEHIHWFGQIISHQPGMLEQLANYQQGPEMDLHLQALQKVLTLLEYKCSVNIDTHKQWLKQWLNHISVFRNTIDSILSIPSEHPLAVRGRMDWQLIQVLQIFADTVMLVKDIPVEDKELIVFGNRLHWYMKKNPDFLKSDTLKRLKQFLYSVTDDCKSKPKKTVRALKKCCDVFLIKVVSSLCFSQQSAPEDELIQKLLDLIFTGTSQEEESTKIATRELAFKQKKDETPIIRSFLLQMLLEHNFDQLRRHLDDFFKRSKRSLPTDLNEDLCFMCTQCFEDAQVKRCTLMPPEERMTTCAKLLISGASYIGQVNTEISLEQLESIANIRYALAVAADVLHRHPDISIVVDTVPHIVSQSSKNSSDGEYGEQESDEQYKHSNTNSESELEPDPLQLAQTIKTSSDPPLIEHVPTDTPPAEPTTSKLVSLSIEPAPSVTPLTDPLITCLERPPTEPHLTEPVTSDTLSTHIAPFESQYAELLPPESLPSEQLPSEPLPAKLLPTEPLPAEPLPAELLPAEPLPAEPLPQESLPEQPLPEEPLPVEPLPVEPLPTEPLPAELLPAKPLLAEPLSAEPITQESLPTEPLPAEPLLAEPLPTELLPTEPLPTEPLPTEPLPTKPVPSEPFPAKLLPTELLLVEPLPAEPLPAEPLPVEPLPAELLPSEPLPAEPLPQESLLEQPLPEEPLPVEPLPIEPLPAEPLPAELLPTEPLLAEPLSAEPITQESLPVEPLPAEPLLAEPLPTELLLTKPLPTEPLPTEPLPTKPLPTKPVPSEPLPAEPLPAEPLPSEPLLVESLFVEPLSTEPITQESLPAEPLPAAPLPTEPLPTEPLPSELLLEEPLPAESLAAKPLPEEPLHEEPLSAEPLSAEPLPAEPLPAEPLPAEPLPSEQLSAEPITQELLPAEPLPAEPLSTEPLPTEPLPSEQLSEEPLATEPLPAKPLSAEPLPAELLPAEPLPAEPLPAEPLPAEPLPAEPLPAEPLSGEPLPAESLIAEPVPAESLSSETSLTEPYSIVPTPQEAVDPLFKVSLLPHAESPGHISGHITQGEEPSYTGLLATSFVTKGRDPASQLLLAAQFICKETGPGPGNYLLKLIVRQYGFTFLRRLVKNHPWVVPSSLRWTGEEENSYDPFVIYGDQYIHLREAVGSAAYTQQLTDLADVTKDMQSQGAALLSLGIHQIIANSNTRQSSNKPTFPKSLQEMEAYFQSKDFLSKEMKLLVKTLIANEYGGPLVALKTLSETPIDQQIVSSIVVHAVIVLLSRNKADILLPFYHMLHDPSALAKAYLPTMPEGIEQENLIAISKSGIYYECLNGHPILASDVSIKYDHKTCGKLRVNCTECGALLKNVSEEFDLEKETAFFMGHCLGRPESRSPLPSSMRHLSPAACSVVRAIMHSALVYVSCNSTTATEGLLEMVRVEDLHPSELPEFFWRHLETDVKDLAQAIGKNEDEAAIVLHLILKQILTSDPPTTGSVKAISSLENAVMRNKWEDMFNACYIQGILENINKEIRSTMDRILEDSKQEHDPLLYMVYEHESSASGEGVEPFLWTYRSRVTLDHLSLLLQPQRDKYLILTEFLNQEPTLRATQYLPDIVKLQLQLQKRYHHRISVKEAQEKTIGNFFEETSLPKKLLTSLKTAWSIARVKLHNHGRVKVERRHLDRLAEISEDTPLHYIIPTTSGPGACGLALVDFLVLQHNNFIEMCQGVVVGDDKSKLFWKEHKVPLHLVHCCHLLDYEPHLLSIVLSHCHYSLQVGKGQDVTYDLAALEKHILDRFIQGKPRIEMEIQQVAYAKDWYISANFSSVRMKVRQVELSNNAQQDILSDLVEIDQLCDSLDVVNILLGFLATGGGRADTRLDDYLRKLRMKSKPISKMAKQHCKLEHILSLWKTLSVGLGKKMISRGQEPFDTDSSLLQDLNLPSSDDISRLDMCLRSFPPEQLELFLGTMCEFVESFLKHNIGEKQNWPLSDVMEGFLEQNQLEVPPQLAELPKSILLPHTVALWKYIVDFQKNKHL